MIRCASTPRQRLQQRLLIVGGGLAVCGALAGVAGGGNATTAHLSLAVAGILVAALPMEPYDRARTLSMIWAVAVVTSYGAAEQTAHFIMRRHDDGLHVARTRLAVAAVCVLGLGGAVAAAIWPWRTICWRQEKGWLTMGWFHAGLAIISVVLTAMRLVEPAPSQDSATRVWALVTTAIVVPLNVACAWAALRVDVRIRLRAHLGWSLSERATALASRLTARGAADPHLRARSLARFRCVEASRLEFAPFESRAPDPSLHALATPCSTLGDVDAFISHSWLDDPREKWAALQKWVGDFRAKFGREPRIWIDKWCMDQDRLEEDLPCIPLFLCGCRRIVVLAGASYLQRRWCVCELWLYMRMGGAANLADVFLLPSFQEAAVASFDVAATQCDANENGDQLLLAIESADGGRGHFNRHVQRLFRSAIARARGAMPEGPATRASRSFSLGGAKDGGQVALRRWSRTRPTSKPARRGVAVSIPEFVLITDPGPDPDDVKSILILGTLHARGALKLRAVVANGGGHPEDRAVLALCLLDALGLGNEVPVGVGSAGEPREAAPHEFSLAGFDNVDRGRLYPGAWLLREAVRDAEPHSLRVVCISSLRDVFDLASDDEAAFIAAVSAVYVQGGLEWNSSEADYRPDTSTNNQLDMAAAERLYALCMRCGVPLRVVSRHAVPMVPMQLARSFADRAEASSVMRYLADAQYLGLCALWGRVCRAEVPARCTREWFWETFGSPDTAAMVTELGEHDNVRDYLSGAIKPYDVVAVMLALPTHEHLLAGRGTAVVRNGVEHRLLMKTADLVPVAEVLALLRETYNHVLALSGEATPQISSLSAQAPVVRPGALDAAPRAGPLPPGAVAEVMLLARAQVGARAARASAIAVVSCVGILVAMCLGFQVGFVILVTKFSGVLALYALYMSPGFHICRSAPARPRWSPSHLPTAFPTYWRSLP